MRRAVCVVLLLAGAGLRAEGLLDFDAEERRAILRHGPWPPAAARDASNRASGSAPLAALGALLFFDARLSATGALSCASCHDPRRGWSDARATAAALGRLERNTQSLWNAGYNRWFGWDGGGDSLWAQSLRPILDARELGADAAHAARLVRGDARLACLYARGYGPPPGADDEQVFVGAGKALAAFLETLVSGRTPFDEFRDALERGDERAAARYPLAAQRGLRIFVGKGRCSVCHYGAQFTHGEFHDIGVPYFVAGGVDTGRHAGIRRLRADRYNLLGPYSDDATGAAATKTRHVELQGRNFGEFRVPGLRNVEASAPYMHNGRLATLEDVVQHYSTLDPERLHGDGERLLVALRLAPAERADLVAFLRTLSEPRAAARAQELAGTAGRAAAQACSAALGGAGVRRISPPRHRAR